MTMKTAYVKSGKCWKSWIGGKFKLMLILLINQKKKKVRAETDETGSKHTMESISKPKSRFLVKSNKNLLQNRSQRKTRTERGGLKTQY